MSKRYTHDHLSLVVVSFLSVCDESDNSILFNNQTTTIDGISYYIGIPQFCTGGTYGRVCNDGTNYPGYGSIFCRSTGFACKLTSVHKKASSNHHYLIFI